MKSAVKRLLFAVGLIPAFAGCYTQFTTLESYDAPPKAKTVVDSTGDTVEVVERVDTVRIRDREVCYWRRDFFGRPVLRCYDSYYDADWHFYHDYPWWYRDYMDYSYHGCHCPFHSRYHPSCSYCWDYCNLHCTDCYHSSSSGGSAYPAYRSTRPSGSGSRGGSGQTVRPSGGGSTGDPLIAGPRPGTKPTQLPKETTTGPEPVQSKTPPAASQPKPSPQQRDSTASRARQPRRRYGRTR